MLTLKPKFDLGKTFGEKFSGDKNSIVFSSDSKYVYYAFSSFVQCASVDGEHHNYITVNDHAKTERTESIQLVNDGRTMITVGFDGNVRGWKVSGPDMGYDRSIGFQVPNGAVAMVAKNYDDRIVVSNSRHVIAYDFQGNLINEIEISADMSNLAFSLGCTMIAVPDCRLGKINICNQDLIFQHQIPVLRGICSLCWSNIENYVAVGYRDGGVGIYQHNGKRINFFDNHSDQVTCVRFYGEYHLISCSWDGTINIYEIFRDQTTTIKPNLGMAKWLEISPDGEILVAGISSHLIGYDICLE